MPDLISSESTFCSLAYDQPIITTAIHNGHQISINVEKQIGISEPVRFLEEDPFTEFFTTFCSNKIIQIDSRFEYDVNRSEEKCIYTHPDLAFGLPVYPNGFPPDLKDDIIQKYHSFYQNIHQIISDMLKKFPRIFVWDIHSFNLLSKPEEARPHINLGTSNIKPEWHALIQSIASHFNSQKFQGQDLVMKINYPFPGGYFPQWLNHFFGDKVCALSIEFGKHFMNEQTGEINIQKMYELRELFYSVFPLIMNHLNTEI